MRQYTETYRIKLDVETKRKLDELKPKYRITPTSFIRQAIAEKLAREIPAIRAKQTRDKLPF